ncbi:cupin domain-containing protein [bacterium]|nr:cupin domain-containing protein [bacterium]
MNLPISSFRTKTEAEAPVTLHFLGNLLTLRVTGADTGGSFSIIECVSAPGAGAPPHAQNDQEAFLVTDGTFEFLLNGSTQRCGPGSFLHVPAGALHAFTNVASTPSRMLILNTPGGAHEGFFRAVGEVMAPGETAFPPMGAPDLQAIVAAGAKFGIEIPLPSAA